eukprot:6312377-Pyramimonas_sp.AAC.1
MASQVVVGCSRLGFAVCGRKPAWGWRRHGVASHVSMRCVFEEASNWSKLVDFRSVVAQGCRTQVRGLRVGRGVTASVLAVLRSYIHSSAQTHCALMLHHVSSPPDSAVDGEE